MADETTIYLYVDVKYKFVRMTTKINKIQTEHNFTVFVCYNKNGFYMAISIKQDWRLAMLKVAVVDDEEAVTETVKEIIVDYFRGKDDDYKVKTYHLPMELIWDLEENDEYFDIYLLDIEMEEVKGLDLAQKIREISAFPFIIFVTSYMCYSIKGYQYNAWRYITKDVMREQIPQTLDSILGKLAAVKPQFYIIKTTKQTIKINYEDIYYIYVSGKYVAVKTKKETPYMDRNTLRVAHQSLNSKAFIMVNKSYIVNLKHVMEMDKRILFMRDNEKIEVSYPQYQKVRKDLVDFWKGRL